MGRNVGNHSTSTRVASLNPQGASLLWPSVCDLVSCDVPECLTAKAGLQPVLSNPTAECRPSYLW